MMLNASKRINSTVVHGIQKVSKNSDSKVPETRLLRSCKGNVSWRNRTFKNDPYRRSERKAMFYYFRMPHL